MSFLSSDSDLSFDSSSFIFSCSSLSDLSMSNSSVVRPDAFRPPIVDCRCPVLFRTEFRTEFRPLADDFRFLVGVASSTVN